MKLVVPLTMPITRRIGSPRRLSRSAAHERDAAGDGGLEQQVDAVAVGGLEQLDADVGEQLLVGRDDRLAAGEGGGDQLAGRLDAADHLDDEVDVGVGDDVVGVAGEDAGGELDVAVAGEVAHGDPGDLEAHAGAGLDLLGLLGDQADERAADVAAAEHADADVSTVHTAQRLRRQALISSQCVVGTPQLARRLVARGIASPKLMPMSRAVRIVSQSSGTVFSRLVASPSGT